MTPAQILQLRAAIANMQRSQGGITGAAARRWNAVGGLANRVGSYISGSLGGVKVGNNSLKKYYGKQFIPPKIES